MRYLTKCTLILLLHYHFYIAYLCVSFLVYCNVLNANGFVVDPVYRPGPQSSRLASPCFYVVAIYKTTETH